jgi:dihydrofolate reductase
MRKLIYAINLSLDGCFDHTSLMVDDEIGEYFFDLVRHAGLFVYGRITYQLMVPYWPDIAKNPAGENKGDIEFAEAFVATKKVVFSRTLKSLEDKNARIARESLKDEILKLKGEEGKYILVGGVDIPSQLIELGLVDEYYFVVQPVFAGKGKRLFEGVSLQEKLKLKLVDSRTFKSGSIALHYLKQ